MTHSKYQFLSADCENNILVVRLEVEILMGDDLVSQVEDEMRAVVDAFAATKVVVDLQRVKEISSRGVGSLAVFYDAFVKKNGGAVALCNVTPFVADVLSTVRFITTKGIRRLANLTPAGIPAEDDTRETKVLFEHFAADVPGAVAVLSGVA